MIIHGDASIVGANRTCSVFYFSMWYKRKERQFRVALFFSAAAFAGAFGGILAWGIAHMDGVGGQAGWR